MRVFGMVGTRSTEAYTKRALESFVEHTEIRPFDRFVFIDNDGCNTPLPEALNSIAIREIPLQPRSFAQNLNETMVSAFKDRADLFFLNNDLVFTPNWITPLTTPEKAILSPFSNREIQHTHKGFIWKNSLSLEDYESRVSEFQEVAAYHAAKVRGVHQVISLPFFCIKIPYLVYEQLGPLDEGFGRGGGEDYDYCLRAAEKNIPVKYYAQSYVLHFSGKATWSGTESSEETATRKAAYTSLFQKKWGSLLTRLLIEEDSSVLAQIPEATELVKKGALQELISRAKKL